MRSVSQVNDKFPAIFRPEDPSLGIIRLEEASPQLREQFEDLPNEAMFLAHSGKDLLNSYIDRVKAVERMCKEKGLYPFYGHRLVTYGNDSFADQVIAVCGILPDIDGILKEYDLECDGVFADILIRNGFEERGLESIILTEQQRACRLRVQETRRRAWFYAFASKQASAERFVSDYEFRFNGWLDTPLYGKMDLLRIDFGIQPA